MAQIVDYYSATAGGSSAMYYYQYADNTSTATRIYTGTPIQLPADYAARMEDTMYPLKSPSGWMHWYHIQDITPVYNIAFAEQPDQSADHYRRRRRRPECMEGLWRGVARTKSE